jgi:hypothetical protein
VQRRNRAARVRQSASNPNAGPFAPSGRPPRSGAAIISFARDPGDAATALDYARRLVRLAPDDADLEAFIEKPQSHIDNLSAQ